MSETTDWSTSQIIAVPQTPADGAASDKLRS
jgi:hypothetical protein